MGCQTTTGELGIVDIVWFTERMKSPRTIGLLIALVLITGGAVYYFSNQEAFYREQPLEVSINDNGQAVYIHWGNFFGGQPPVTPDANNVVIEEIPFENADYVQLDSTGQSEEIVQNIFLAEQNNHKYSLFVREYLERSARAPWPLANKYELANRVGEPTEQFFITDTSSLKTSDRYEIIRTYKNVASGATYPMQLAYFWTIGDAVAPEKAIATFINPDDPAILQSGACQVEKIETPGDWIEGMERRAESVGPAQYQIVFKIENLDATQLQKISGKSLSGVCGKNGPMQASWGSVTGTFIVDNGVLIYLDGQTSVWSPYNIIRVTKTGN